MRSYEAEKSLLGFAFNNPDRIVDLIQVVQPYYFTSADTISAWTAISKCFIDGIPINRVTVSHLIPQDISAEWLYEPSDVYKPKVYVDILHSNWLRRELAAGCNKATAQLADTAINPLSIRDELENTLLGLVTDGNTKGPIKIDVAIKRAMIMAKDNSEVLKNRGIIGVDLISSHLNYLTAGARPKELWLLAGRTGMGKSLTVNEIINRNSQDLGKEGLIISPEMTAENVCFRLIATRFKIGAQRLASGFLRKAELVALYRPIVCRGCGGVNISSVVKHKDFQVINECRDCGSHDVLTALDEYQANPIPLHIDDRSGLTIAQVVATIKAHKILNAGLEYVIIDYINLITGGAGDTRAEEVKDICQKLRDTAKQLNVCIIAVAQLNREYEKRQNKRPILTDLKEAGALEETADGVIFVYRDSYQDVKNQDTLVDGELILAKQRNGPIGTGLVQFDLSTQSVIDKEKGTSYEHSEDSDNEAC